jgi:heptosyltransferase-3
MRQEGRVGQPAARGRGVSLGGSGLRGLGVDSLTFPLLLGGDLAEWRNLLKGFFVCSPMRPRRRILIFQIGSLGDTVISMPCYREIARRHPDAAKYVLTNSPAGGKTVQAEALLAPCGLIDGALQYPVPLRGWRNMIALYRSIRALDFAMLYYLCPEKRTANIVRHYLFFKACGIGEIRGAPWTRDKRFPRPLEGGLIWESEGSRLLRTIGAQEEPGPPDFKDRSLDLSGAERGAAQRLLREAPGLDRFIAISVGGKVPIKDWGDSNWSKVFSSLSTAHPGLGAVFVGSEDEWARNESLSKAWSGPTLNSCGRMTPRETAALIERAVLFLGHDTGTLHLAAAVGTRILGVYCARDVPGKWYSDNPGDRFFYNRPACFNCGLTNVADCPNQVLCMSSHKTDQIVRAATEVLADARNRCRA